jgi:hypothetical protein
MPKGDWNQWDALSADTYGSSYEFRQDLRDRRPDLIVPESLIVMIEGSGSDWNETPPGPGETCGLCFGNIRPGSYRYCPRCRKSGFDWRLGEQLRLSGAPSRDARPREDSRKGGKR